MAVRDARHLSQDALGVAQSSISRLERGSKVPSRAQVEEFADLLNAHPLTLFTLAYASETDAEVLLGKVSEELGELKGR